MNKPNDHFDEREWRLQERALREERLGADAAADPGLAAYRRVVRALREPMAHRLPPGFAAEVAKRADAQRSARASGGLERALVQALSAAFAASALYVVAGHGGEWLRASLQVLPAADAVGFRNWGLVLGACLAMTWALDRALDRARGHAPR
jgi:hypothetical protein